MRLYTSEVICFNYKTTGNLV